MTESKPVSSIYAWGRVFGILDTALGGLTPATLQKAAATPVEVFGLVMTANAAKLGPQAHRDIAAQMDFIDPDQKRIGEAAQGDWWLGFYRDRDKSSQKGAGAPPAEKRVNWPAADWTKADATLAREFSVTRQTVAAQRKRHTPKSKE